MPRITFQGRAITKVKTSRATKRFEKEQRGFIIILLMMIIFLFVITPVGCATLLALLTGTGAAAAP